MTFTKLLSLKKMNALRILYKYIRFWGGPYQCIVCSSRVRRFFQLSQDIQQNAFDNGFSFDFKRMETLNYYQCNCPFCLSSDRERLYLIYIEDYLIRTTSNPSVLDFAPNPAFAKKLRQISNYVSADLFREDVDLKTDICDMQQVKNSNFDFIICSHVLEHVTDPDKALSEIARVLKPEGKAIIMVPLFWDVKSTVEDANHNTDALRLRYYGQEDHVRLFSREDFLTRLYKAGFKVEELTPSNFNTQKVRQNAIADNSILYLCSIQN